ncbi:MAG: Holliday junction DNA helicase RuvB [Candidatus Kerfeldbacteria bacterium RIFCSPHIGHO2_12_FULL_48_17]|uniref:Holliday junction branch migration complex subunit RuvB n=1 Tax=Candidatus Kerfeldbacteria bacterium RIFCSPHIGHO2_12_FULL_48_17 TaxID=1798542 RepID=A0A1G2B8M8_9BACT|nr:MAG: Holliday junction DNA helicase RuvB [Candidatus Kerfeldbacteria bacterium RIFCSPHIGHO2_12_FULL_48_17]
MAEDRIISPTEREEEQQFDASLRPKTLQDYIGQEAIKANLKIFIEAAKQREESLEHVLLHGAPGLGKTTLAHIIAREMGVNIRITSGTAIERAGDLAAILTNLQPGDILFIDEIHRLHRTIEEVLYPAMEDYALDLVVGKGPGAKTLRLDLPKFTIIGATTRMSLLSSPLRDRFGNSFRLDFYQPQDLQKILTRSARILNVTLDSPSSQRISQCARQTPRIANRLLKRVRDYAQVHGDGIIALPLAEKALSMLEIDHMGLDTLDRRILEIIIDKFQGGPVGLHTIAATTGEEIDTIADVYEPFLLQLGLLARTLRGRIATEQAYKHLKRSLPTQTQKAAI